ncbi:MAG: phosphoribosyltransferase family protein, partial [Caldivirga sp.]
TYMADSPPRKVSLYIPRLLLTKEDSVIIVDDIVRSGRTVDALLSIIRQAGASLVGVSILVAASRDVVKAVKNRINGATLDVIYTIE